MAYKRVSLLHLHYGQISANEAQAEAAATAPPLPGVPLQVRNAPTRLMKKLGYGKHYSYNPDFAHPVFNVSSHDFVSGRQGKQADMGRSTSHSNYHGIHLLPTRQTSSFCVL